MGSGLLETQNSFSQEYGYFEIRAQLPSDTGVWPAFWLMPENDSWPPEIDVFEAYGTSDLYQTVHTAVTGSDTTQTTWSNQPSMLSGFHTYGVLWTPDQITFYFDGNAVGQQSTPADLHQPMYMLIDLAMQAGAGVSTDPKSMQVDYVRVYSNDPNATAVPLETVASPYDLSTAAPVVLNDFGWAQGWGSPDNPRMIADVTGSGSGDYVGFGDKYTFVAYGGTFANGGQTGPGFSPAVASVRDFGTDEGYTASAQRGAAAVGVGDGDILYGQGFAGIYWYAATGETPQTDAAGDTYDVLQYQTSPDLYGNFGTAQGWTPANGFEILKSTASDGYASILGFGDAGIVVGPQAFAPGATAASSYVIPFAAGNNSGWSQETDIRTFTDTNGNPIDLNGDGIADFVGMGPQGLAFAYGNDNGPNGSYELGPLQNAQINGTSDSLGDAQGWNDATSVRYIVPDAQTGHDDIIAFGAAGVYVSMGQNPAANNGQPFGQLYLAMADMGTDQGWTSQTPRLIGDVTGDGIPDIVGFGDASTFVATGSHNANGQLVFTMDPSLTIPDFGVTEGWSGSNPQTLRALAQLPGSSQTDLVLSGAANTQTWQFA